MSSSWASDYIKSEGMDPLQLSNLLGVPEESAATIVKNILAEGIDLNALSQRLTLSKEETVHQLQSRSLQDPQSQLSSCISDATQPLRQPVLTILPHWQAMSQIVNQQTLNVDNNLSNLLITSGQDAFQGQTASQLGLIQFDIRTKGNLLTTHVNNIIQAHQTFVNGTADTLSSVNRTCQGMQSYPAAAVMLEIEHGQWMASIFLPFAPPRAPQAPQQAPPQLSPEGGSGFLRMILEILRNYWWLIALIALVTALLDELDKWSKSMQSLSQKNLGLLNPQVQAPLSEQQKRDLETLLEEFPNASRDDIKGLLLAGFSADEIRGMLKAGFTHDQLQSLIKRIWIARRDQHGTDLLGLTEAQIRDLVNRVVATLNSPDENKRLEGEVAQLLIANVVSFQRKIYDPVTGEQIGEIDVETATAIIEVTNGQDDKLKQLLKELNNPYINPQHKVVILYAPQYSHAADLQFAELGITIARTWKELLDELRLLGQ